VSNVTGEHEPQHPLAEVFGYPIANNSPEARRARIQRTCRFHNKVPWCTKVSRTSPLGVCSVFEDGHPVITCPIRFRENWVILDHASRFFFSEASDWTSFAEVRLRDAEGNSAGNIDFVLVAFEAGLIRDFGALEIQSVYISGNISEPFQAYMQDPEQGATFSWTERAKYPRPDYLSSSRKRLAPQLITKGGILNSWGKKMAVAIDEAFFATLPTLPQVDVADAEIAWLVYDLCPNQSGSQYLLQLERIIYTKFEASLTRLTALKAGPMAEFVGRLQVRLADQLNSVDSDQDR
jgi:hypothetical protein